MRLEVQKRRTEMKMTQENLAKECGVKKEIIRDIESNKLKPENKLHQKLRRILKIP